MSRRIQNQQSISPEGGASHFSSPMSPKKNSRKKPFRNPSGADSSSHEHASNNHSSHNYSQNNHSKNGNMKKNKPLQNNMYDRLILQAREAAASGDHVTAERFYQQADHQLRLINESKKNQSSPPISPPKNREKFDTRSKSPLDEENKVKETKFRNHYSRSENSKPTELSVENKPIVEAPTIIE